MSVCRRSNVNSRLAISAKALVQRLSQGPRQLGDEAGLDAGEGTIRPRLLRRFAVRRRLAAEHHS